MVERACGVCGKGYTAKRDSSRYCSDTCRKRAQRMGGAPAAPIGSEERAAPSVGQVEARTRAELDAAGRLDTALGAQVLLLARRLDGSGRDPLQAVASLQKRLEEALTVATAGATKVADPVDELKAARERKHAG